MLSDGVVVEIGSEKPPFTSSGVACWPVYALLPKPMKLSLAGFTTTVLGPLLVVTARAMKVVKSSVPPRFADVAVTTDHEGHRSSVTVIAPGPPVWNRAPPQMSSDP